METMKKEANVAEYLELVQESAAKGDEYLVNHFGVIGTENFKEGSYNKFVSEVMAVVEERMAAEVEQAAAEAVDAIEANQEVATDEPEVQEAETDSETSN